MVWVKRRVPVLRNEKYDSAKSMFGKIKKGHEIFIQDENGLLVCWVANTREKNGKLEIQLFCVGEDDFKDPYGEDRWYRVGRQENVLVSYKPRPKRYVFCWYCEEL